MNRRYAVYPTVSGRFDRVFPLPDSCCHNNLSRYFHGKIMARNTRKSGAGALKPGVSLALAATTLLALSACSDPGATAAADTPTSSSSSGPKTFNLSPQQDRVPVTVDEAAAALVPEAIRRD